MRKPQGGQRKPSADHKTMATLRFGPSTLSALNDLVGILGVRKNAVVEHAIHQLRQHHRDLTNPPPLPPALVEEEWEERYTTCPFCPETDFDQMGLKMHLTNGWCEAYVAIPTSPPLT